MVNDKQTIERKSYEKSCQGCAGHKADSAVSPLPLLPQCQSKDCPQEEGPGEGGRENERLIKIWQN